MAAPAPFLAKEGFGGSRSLFQKAALSLIAISEIPSSCLLSFLPATSCL